MGRRIVTGVVALLALWGLAAASVYVVRNRIIQELIPGRMYATA